MFFDLIFCKIQKEMFLRNKRGQIAIFVVLIFQVLFILFAMTLNVAFVVHDKINFQNSIDLASYYGAKQQTEVLNAMAHINYQMRQNWKLLSWRYRILGNLTQNEGGSHPEYWCPQNKTGNINCDTSRFCSSGKVGNPADCRSSCLSAQSQLPYIDNYCDRNYFICISADLWKRGIKEADQNLCKTESFTIPAIKNIPIVAPFMAEAYLTQSITRRLQEDLGKSCKGEGSLNWLITQIFLSHFRLDQKDRKLMLREIYNRSLKQGKDLDGNSLFEGAKKVFFNNLSFANQENVKALADYGLQDFNSFKDVKFEEVFEALNVWPVLNYLKIHGSEGSCQSKILTHFDDVKSKFEEAQRNIGSSGHPLNGFLGDEQKTLFGLNDKGRFFNRTTNPMMRLTLGFFKKKDRVLYYGLSGRFNYLSKNQIFSLAGPILFKASSFAKAFGGRFGPQAQHSDPFIPIDHPQAKVSLSSIGSDFNLNPALLQPNYSRWPGDKWGLVDWKLHSNDQKNPYSNFLYKRADSIKNQNNSSVYTIEAFFHLIFSGNSPIDRDDPLARPPDMHPMTFLRAMELMAVYPDVYDLSYYSISSNYMQTYFPRICKLLNGSECQSNKRNKNNAVSENNFFAYIRGDFGWPETDYYIDKNQSEKKVDLSIAPYFLKGGNNTINTSEILLGSQMNSSTLNRLTEAKIFYPWLAQELPAHLLSSWAPTTKRNRYNEYDFPKERFLKCKNPALKGMPVPSSCVVGGRSDYSVKLISCEKVKSFSDQPDNISEYCSK